MDAVLVAFKRAGKRVDIPLRSASVILGRGEHCTIRVPAASVSRQHCELVVEGGQIRAKDLESANGTYVNGNRISEVRLSAGDVLSVGPVNFTLQVDGQPTEFPAFAPTGDQASDEGALVADALADDADVAAALVSEDDGAAGQAADEDSAIDFMAAAADGLSADDDGAISLDGLGESAGEDVDPLSALELLAEDESDDDA